MPWTPVVKSSHSVFDSPLVFEKKREAQESAASMASRLQGLHLKLISIEAAYTDTPPNHFIRDSVLHRITWLTTTR